MAHDIRSPITALEMGISHVGSIPRKQKALLDSAIVRIKDIANDLHRKGKEGVELAQISGDTIESESVERIHYLSALDEIISEKTYSLPWSE